MAKKADETEDGKVLSVVVDVETDTKLSILRMGLKFSYQIPTFSVISVDLRQIAIQLTSQNGTVMLFDGFIRADPSLNTLNVPFTLTLKYFCFVPVSGLQLYSYFTYS